MQAKQNFLETDGLTLATPPCLFLPPRSQPIIDLWGDPSAKLPVTPLWREVAPLTDIAAHHCHYAYSSLEASKSWFETMHSCIGYIWWIFSHCAFIFRGEAVFNTSVNGSGPTHRYRQCHSLDTKMWSRTLKKYSGSTLALVVNITIINTGSCNPDLKVAMFNCSPPSCCTA